jgi:hypothetical protein
MKNPEQIDQWLLRPLHDKPCWGLSYDRICPDFERVGRRNAHSREMRLIAQNEQLATQSQAGVVQTDI